MADAKPIPPGNGGHLPVPHHRPRGRFWPTNVFQQHLTLVGIDQRAQGYVGAIDRVVNRGMNGQSGHIPIGNTASPAFRWNGYTDYGVLAATQTLGASTNLRLPPNVALPTTGGPLVITTAPPLTDVQRALASQSPGMR